MRTRRKSSRREQNEEIAQTAARRRHRSLIALPSLLGGAGELAGDDVGSRGVAADAGGEVGDAGCGIRGERRGVCKNILSRPEDFLYGPAGVTLPAQFTG